MAEEGSRQPQISPDSVGTPREFLDVLRRVKTASGLSFRQIAARAEKAGHFLPHSTLATALSRDTLPSEELVIALVRACGASDEEIESWRAARTRLALGEPAAPAAPAGPAGPAGPAVRFRRLPVLAGLGAGVALIVAVVLAFVLVRGSGPGTTPADDSTSASPKPGNPGLAVVVPGKQPPPGSGDHLIRAAGTKRCLSEKPGDLDGLGHVVLIDCRKVVAVKSLEKVGENAYRIKSFHPKFRTGCMGFDPKSEIATDSACGERTVERFRLESVAKPVRGFRIVLPNGSQCMTVGPPAPRSLPPLLRDQCKPTGAGQIFTFEPN